MSKPELELPQAVPTIKQNGDVVLEVTHHGRVVGGLNVTQVLSNWFEQLGWLQPPKFIPGRHTGTISLERLP
jgi:hypothetical protein